MHSRYSPATIAGNVTGNGLEQRAKATLSVNSASGTPAAKPARVSRILITDSTYKHSIALARYIKKAMPDLHLTGWTRSSKRRSLARWVQSRLPKWYSSCFDNTIRSGSIADALKSGEFDMVIPVGGLAVLEASRTCPQLSVMPGPSQLELCYDKVKTLAFAQQMNVPVPETSFISSLGADIPEPRRFPCVVKPSREAGSWKGVDYCRTQQELKRAVQRQLHELRNDPGAGVLVQEYISGKGHGFFALMDRGTPLRVFMHERIREIPHTGGASCAAKSFWSQRLKELGLRLLRELQWNGIAMVEFKFDEQRRDFVLMEINGKFWGSLELALAAGVNFGADLIRLYRGEKLEYSEEYNRDCLFYWPLDGDLVTLLATRSLGRIRDYRQPHAVCDVGHSLRADLFKVVASLKHLRLR